MTDDSNSKYEQIDYWNKRYCSEESYEWCKKYEDVKHILQKRINKSDRILILGCGNSSLSEDLYKDGYQNITNMDYSSVVINNMSAALSKSCCKMEWTVMDLRRLPFLPEVFDAVIEKATLDSLLVNERDPWNMAVETEKSMKNILFQISQLLTQGGKFISFTFAQPHSERNCFVYLNLIGQFPIVHMEVDLNFLLMK